ncbi:hypothetical protein FA743_12365 [Paracoccus gahaiensis]|uniref:DNA/RNA non-specific endonuclease n=1 Tax=Paracoccus gahaiensis TaxID=1706839 RepID=A0A4V5MV93_9RHOB|nr:hypothetical protein FA743_12365 [Paracoccus gahaiensis]
MGEAGALAGEVAFSDMSFLPRGLGRSATATGSGTVRLAQGRLSGEGAVELAYRDLGNGTVNFTFAEGGSFSAHGTFRVTPPFVDEVSGEIAVDEGNNLSVNAVIAVGEMRTHLPGLGLTGGTLTLNSLNGQPSGGIEGFTASYRGLGAVTLQTATLAASGFAGTGSFDLQVPGLNEASGRVTLRNGALSGQLRLGAEAFPEGLPVTRPSLTVTLGESGRVGVEGSATVSLGPAGTGNFTAAYSDAGQFSFGGDVALTIPGLRTVNAHVGYAEGALSAEVQVPVNTTLLPGLDGMVTVRYAQDRWSGETRLAYSADNGKLSGEITVTVAQTDAGALELGGEGRVTAQIAPRLQGTLTARILPEGAVDVSGVIEVTEPLELFPEQRMDRELFRHAQNIPLWAILVAVIRIRAGVRAGIGPGVFRNIRVEGSYTIGATEADPSFTVSGELFIPAFVEGYVALGAGIGVDVVLGSMTGGIEAVGTAGLYGAISVVPELSYADGDWGIEGTATMAAGARLKLGLNAWAEIEALWVTVWDREWTLAEMVAPIGPDLGLQAHLSYKFGRPEPPRIEMTSSEADYSGLIQDAMPKDGPAPAGAREALQNRAEWQGQLRAQRAAAVPSEQVAQQAQPATPPAAPPRPPQQSAPPGGQGGAAGGPGPAGQAAPGATQATQPGTNPSGANQPQRSKAVDLAAAPDANVPAAVPEGTLPNADQPRYPRPITLAMLDEPPAPTPRTPSQEAEDVQAAGRMVDLASAQATDSDALDNYFPQIKQRFGLVALGYEGDFSKGFRVVGKINPQFERTVSEPLTGTGLPAALNQGHQSRIIFEHSQLGGSQVGLTMRAKPLGPDHEQGSGPTGQEALMNQLPTDPNHYRDPAQRYIRGHLLNDHIGGPGHPMNLFPITASANAEHERSVESFAKDWVNNRKLWIDYTVEVQATPQLRKATGGLKKIDSVITATAAALDTNLNRIAGLTRGVTIASTYNVVEEAEEGAAHDFDAALLDPTTAALQAARPQDQGLTPPRSARETPTTFPATIAATIAQAIAKLGSRSKVASVLQDHPGFGDISETVLFQVYDRVGATGATVDFLGTPAEKGVLTRIINAWSGPNGLGARLEREMSQKSAQT